MGFNLLSAIGGAAKTYVTEMEREEERQSALEDKMKLMEFQADLTARRTSATNYGRMKNAAQKKINQLQSITGNNQWSASLLSAYNGNVEMAISKATAINNATITGSKTREDFYGAIQERTEPINDHAVLEKLYMGTSLSEDEFRSFPVFNKSNDAILYAYNNLDDLQDRFNFFVTKAHTAKTQEEVEKYTLEAENAKNMIALTAPAPEGLGRSEIKDLSRMIDPLITSTYNIAGKFDPNNNWVWSEENTAQKIAAINASNSLLAFAKAAREQDIEYEDIDGEIRDAIASNQMPVINPQNGEIEISNDKVFNYTESNNGNESSSSTLLPSITGQIPSVLRTTLNGYYQMLRSRNINSNSLEELERRFKNELNKFPDLPIQLVEQELGKFAQLKNDFYGN